MNQVHIHVYPLFFRFFPHTGHYRGWSRAPCGIQWFLTIIYFIYNCVYKSNPISQFIPPFPTPWLPWYLRWLRIHLQSRRPRFDFWVGKILWRRDRLPTPVFLGFPGGSAGEESACNAGDLGSIAGLGRSPGEGNGYPLQYSGLENPIDCI